MCPPSHHLTIKPSISYAHHMDLSWDEVLEVGTRQSKSNHHSERWWFSVPNGFRCECLYCRPVSQWGVRRERWDREDANGGNIIKTPNFSVFFWRLGCCTLSWLYTGVFFVFPASFFFCLDLRLLVALTLVCSFTFVLFFFSFLLACFGSFWVLCIMKYRSLQMRMNRWGCRNS